MESSKDRAIRAIAVAMPLMFAIAAHAGERARERADATIAFVNGAVYVNGDSATTGAALKKGDRVSVTESSEVEIRFRDGRVWTRLKEKSELIIVGSGKKVSLSLVRGWFMAFVRPRTKFSIRGPTAGASVRGTVLFMRSESQESTYVCACKGTVLHEAGGKKRLVTADDHTSFETDKQGRPVSMKIKHHSDEDVRSLESRASQDIPK